MFHFRYFIFGTNVLCLCAGKNICYTDTSILEMDDKFCLRWNDFQSDLSRTFKNLRHEEDFYDVTLVSDDQQQIHAHKLVLSSCSQYFSNILKNTKHSNPLLCFENLSRVDVQQVLDYIYNGEVQVEHAQLDRFLDIAERLKLEGLGTARDGGPATQHFEKSKTQEQDHRTFENIENNSWMNFLKNETNVINLTNKDQPIIINSHRFKSLEELDQEILKHMTRREDGKYECTVCGKFSKNKGHSVEHIETHFEGLDFSCNFCNATFKSRNNLRSHKWRIHRGNIVQN